MTIEARAPSKPAKSAAVIKLLSRTRGATSAEMTATTNWQPHSVRAYLTGLRKKGHVLTREARKSGESAYRLVESARFEPTAAVVAPAAENVPAASDGPAVDATTTAPTA